MIRLIICSVKRWHEERQLVVDLVTTQVHFISGGEVGIPPHKSVQSDKDITKQQRRQYLYT